jgi:hypothetical protein
MYVIVRSNSKSQITFEYPGEYSYDDAHRKVTAMNSLIPPGSHFKITYKKVYE